jgi:hypothetical protein
MRLHTVSLAAMAAFLLLALSVGGAQARPRDEVMSGAFRCAAVADSHQWLNCYYGAAQPMRAELGLPPAPSAQMALAASPPGGGTPADLPVRDAVMDGVFRCNSLQGQAWLNCYYGAAQPMRAQLGLSPAPQSQTGLAARAPLPGVNVAANNPSGPPPMPRKSGFLGIMGGGDDLLVRNLPITDYRIQDNGTFRVTLSDGEVWEQTTENAHVHSPHFKGAPTRHTVRVTSGIMDSYDMDFSGVDGFFKVHRLR